MSHSQLQKLNPHGLAQPWVDPRIIGRAEVVNLAGKLYGILAASMDHIAFRILQKFEGFRIAPSAEPSCVLVRVDLRPAVRIGAAPEVEFIAVAAGGERAFNLHGQASSGVHDVGSKFFGGHGVNHRAAVPKAFGVRFGFVQGSKAKAGSHSAAPANRSEFYGIVQAFGFVAIQFGHRFLHRFSNFCLCDWSVFGSKNVMIAQKKEAA